MKERFSELYTRLYNENIQELETLREKNKKESIKLLLMFFLMFGALFIPVVGIFIFIGFWIIHFINASKGVVGKSTKNSKEFKRLFKEKIVTPLIENVFEGSKYEPEKGWARTEYLQGEYRDDIDRYSSEDMITAPVIVDGNIETVMQFAEVHTERESRDSEGRTSYHTEFYGLAGKIKLKKDIGTKIYIRKNGASGIFNNNKVKMDMSEFEKIFDVEAKDRILAVRILTSDVMTEMIELYKKFKYSFEIHIIKDTIYMRISTFEVFEPNVFKNSMEYKTLEKYYKILQTVMSVSKHIYDTINQIEV